MNEQLLIRLASQPEQPISWLVYAPLTADIIASGEVAGVAALAALAERLGRRNVIALVPAADVVLKTVTLPAKPNRQLLQALPYMLEEEQAEDIDKLFIAHGQAELQQGQYRQQVAICQRERLQQWLDWLQQAGFNVSRMLPDALLLPADTLPACIELQQQWLLRLDSWQATAIDSAWWQDYLALAALPQLTTYSPWPEHIVQPHQAAAPELPLALLARGLTATSFNLLQGPYTPKKPQNKTWQQWRLSAALAGGLLLAYLLQLGIGVWQQQRQLTQLTAELQTNYLQLFPGERIVNLNRQLQQKLQAAGVGPNEQNFFVQLQALQQRLEGLPDVKLDSLRYDAARHELRFSASAAGFQSFEQLKTVLEQAGYSIEQGALSNDGSRVQGTVVMRGKV
ncbi:MULTISPECIES: type II secretion system protein GspL [Alishewanella]|uniref:Type II secretion system protein L n=1 Tax=Alishewanella aestuarii B11 TaxID=1197174 RepID=J2IBE4_9ALTE|nr:MULTISPECIES: type II secretion system protein GspL [Alishewanella]EJI84412.1 general secretion pathway protein L [Alishewanella aestuarii B11]OCW98017.1 type II secretion system protein GspL [Alishewanella sp. HH-ZS]